MSELPSVEIDLTTLTIEQLRAFYTTAAKAVNAALAEAQRREALTTDDAPNGEEPAAQTVAATPLHPVTEAGMYRQDGVIYKVQKAVHGSGHLYAKRLVLAGEIGTTGLGSTSAHFEYAAGMIRKLYAEDRMTLEDAKEFGHLYGVCCKCGATLTDENSIAAGIGPICAGKGW